jgi:four helix bundle protein
MLDELPKSRGAAVRAGAGHYHPRNDANKIAEVREMHEEGSQIRRAIKSVKSNIVEGYGRRRYKQEFIRFVDYALASCNENADSP